MLKIREAVVVEGKYDKIRLSNILDTLIVETNGFGIYKDNEKLSFIKKLADERGIIILTDSDHSGFQIRSYISSCISKDKIKHIYIPDVYGKERRKTHSSKEGKLGVEGINEKILLELFEKANISAQSITNQQPVTSYDLFKIGVMGVPDSKNNKKKLLKALDLPEHLSTNSLLSYVNSSMNKDEFLTIADNALTSSST